MSQQEEHQLSVGDEQVVTPERLQVDATRVPPEPTPTHEHLSVPTSRNALMLSVLAIIVVALTLMYQWGSRAQEYTTLPLSAQPAVPVPSDDSYVPNQLDLESAIAMPELDGVDAELDALETDLGSALAE